MENYMCKKIISEGLAKGLQNKLPKPIAKLIKPLLFAAIGISKIDRIYEGACNIDSDDNFAEKLLHKDVMNIKLDIPESDLGKIPKEGPLVVVANHPYGGVDGVALLALLKRVRPDVKLMANYVLGGLPALREHFFLVDPFGNKDSSLNSFGGIRDTLKWLKNGHVLGIFPAGEVSTYIKSEKRVIDKEWGEAAGMIIKSGKCPVQSIFFNGHNSRFFQLLGKINPVLRTLWLARECGRACNHDISVKIGEVISAEICKNYKTPKELMEFLKNETYALTR
jgi:putative hemolysin